MILDQTMREYCCKWWDILSKKRVRNKTKSIRANINSHKMSKLLNCREFKCNNANLHNQYKWSTLSWLFKITTQVPIIIFTVRKCSSKSLYIYVYVNYLTFVKTSLNLAEWLVLFPLSWFRKWFHKQPYRPNTLNRLFGNCFCC